MRISDWSSDVCSSDLVPALRWRAYVELGGHLLGFWAASAAAFLCYLAAFPAIDAPGAVQTAGTFLVSWAAGFVAVFAPQGAGVFETTMAGLLDGPVAAPEPVIAGYQIGSAHVCTPVNNAHLVSSLLPDQQNQ